MGLSLDTSFSADLMASGSSDYIRQSGEESADTPFQLPDYSGQEEPDVTSHRDSETQPSSSDTDAFTSSGEEGHVVDVTVEPLAAADAATTETADEGGIVPSATSSLSALPDSMIWMQPQDFQALLRADLAELDTMATTEPLTDPALVSTLELATDVNVADVVADEPHPHGVLATTTLPVDSASAPLSASLQASGLAFLMSTPVAFAADRSSAAATATDATSPLLSMTAAEPAASNTRFLSRDGALSMTTAAADTALPKVSGLNSQLSSSFANRTLAGGVPQPTTVSSSAEAELSRVAGLGAPALSATADAAAALRPGTRTTPLVASTVLDSSATTLLTGGGPSAATLTPTAVQNQLVVDNSHSGWGQQLVSSLGERVHLQASQQLQQATIRLDPPELGRLEVTVRQESDRLSVQISTSNSALRDALQETREQLRQILIPQYGAGVEVEINYSGDGRQQAQTEALLEEEIVSNGITLATAQEVAEAAGAVVNSGLLDTLV